MKLLYISKEIFDNKYRSLFKSLGIESMHYINPLKASDNLLEIKPDILFMNKNDFPRLWKIILTSLRELYDDKQCGFILEGTLDKEELNAFKYLKGSINIDNAENEIKVIKDYIIDRTDHIPLSKSYFPMDGELCISFVKPNDYSFVSGSILELKENLLIFELENSDDLNGLLVQDIIKDVSINLNNDVVTANIKIISLSKHIVCQIISGIKEYTEMTNLLFV